ncbi:hypothetical protein BSKO_07307 [Bryopsis sp. KO-2023]|nr:hypothetical protein BSKO_07307 [Bryopsis sp. KO-2023]
MCVRSHGKTTRGLFSVISRFVLAWWSLGQRTTTVVTVGGEIHRYRGGKIGFLRSCGNLLKITSEGAVLAEAMNSGNARKKKPISRNGKRKVDPPLKQAVVCKRTKQLPKSEGGTQWCPLGDAEQEVRVYTGIRHQKTRPRSPTRLSNQIRALIDCANAHGLEARKKREAKRGVSTSAGSGGRGTTSPVKRNGAQNACQPVIQSPAPNQASKPKTTNPSDINVQRLRESILSALTEQQKAVLVTLPMEKRRAFIKTYVERQMQLELHTRLHSDASNLASNGPQRGGGAQPDITARKPTVLDQSHQAVPPNASTPPPQPTSLKTPTSNALEPLPNGTHNSIAAPPRTVTKGGLSYTEVGRGQYVCSGIPQMTPFGVTQDVPVKVDWPLLNGKPPVRMLHGDLKGKGILMVSEKINYVVPVDSKKKGAEKLACGNGQANNAPLRHVPPKPGQAGTPVSVQNKLGCNGLAGGTATGSSPSKSAGPDSVGPTPAHPHQQVNIRTNPQHMMLLNHAQSSIHRPASINMNLPRNIPNGVHLQRPQNGVPPGWSANGVRIPAYHPGMPNGCLPNGHTLQSQQAMGVKLGAAGQRGVAAQNGLQQKSGVQRPNGHPRNGGTENNGGGVLTRARAQQVQGCGASKGGHGLKGFFGNGGGVGKWSSCLKVAPMDSYTRDLLAALDSGDLATSLLDNPFC